MKSDLITETQADDTRFVSSVFLREKNNKYQVPIKQRHFKMDNLSTELTMVRKKCYMTSLDLADACYSVPVAVVNQKYCFLLTVDSIHSYVYPMIILQH